MPFGLDSHQYYARLLITIFFWNHLFFARNEYGINSKIACLSAEPIHLLCIYGFANCGKLLAQGKLYIEQM